MKLTAFFYVVIALIPFPTNAQIMGSGKPIDPFKYESQKSGVYSKGVVASAHPLASKVGLEMFKRGGNAFDAAIATQLALAVVFPFGGNIGGGGFLVARTQKGKLIALDYRETAPRKASSKMFIHSIGGLREAQAEKGHLAVCVPGVIAGLFTSLKYAKLPFDTLIQPAIELAQKGFVITTREARRLNEHQTDFIALNTKPTIFSEVKVWRKGDTLKQVDLSNTLKRIRDNGVQEFYEGETANLIVEEMQRGGGILTLDDLRNYTVKEKRPEIINYKGYSIIGMPPPSSAIALLQMMKMVEGRLDRHGGPLGVYNTQLMIEAQRRAFQDRAAYIADPDYVEVPTAKMMSQEYLAEKMEDYDTAKAGVTLPMQDMFINESNETTHISVVDRWGNMVSATITLNGYYGSKVVVGGAGFFLNNEIDLFNINYKAYNRFNENGGYKNRIEPGKRMLSSMAPTLVLKNDKPFLIAGTSGGTKILSILFQILINVIEYDMSAADAIDTPKFHHQGYPDVVFISSDFPEATKKYLGLKGYEFAQSEYSGYQTGRPEIIKIVNNKFEAAASKGGDDSIAGF